MDAKTRMAHILKPLGRTSKKYYLLIAAAGAALVWFL